MHAFLSTSTIESTRAMKAILFNFLNSIFMMKIKIIIIIFILINGI
jgi:hypothetical protein